MGKRKADDQDGSAKKRKAITLETKVDIIKRSEKGETPTNIGRALGLSRSTVATIIKDKERVLENVKGSAPMKATVITKKRSVILFEVERLLVLWIEAQNQKSVPLSLALIQEKARMIHATLKDDPRFQGEGSSEETFSASRGWFQRFKNRAGLHNLCVQGEATSADQASAASYPDMQANSSDRVAGLTACDDRGSSEYSQNDDKAAASGSPEFLGDGNEWDPIPTPVAQTPPKPESYQLQHNNHLTILEALARDEAFMDVTLTAQGHSLKAHKSVLSAVSPYFRGVLRENPCQHPIIIMPRDVRFEELFSIVNYIYKGEMTVAADDLTSLLKTAEVLQVSGLALSDSTATFNLHTAANIRSSSSSPSAPSNVPPVAKMPKAVKETNQGISAPVTRPKSPKTMINPSYFIDMDITYVKEEVQSGGEDDDEEVTPSETPAQPSGNASPKATEISQDSVTFTSVYNQNQEQTSRPSNSSQEANNIPIKTEADMDGRSTVEQGISITKIPQPFVCPHCQGVHRGFENLNNHLRLNHPTKPSFPCATCGRVFTRSAAHQAHVNECNVSS